MKKKTQVLPSAEFSIFYSVLVQMTCHAVSACAWEYRQSPSVLREICVTWLFLIYSTHVSLVMAKMDGRTQCCSCQRTAVTFVLAWHILEVFLKLEIWAWILKKWTLVYFLTLILYMSIFFISATSCNEQFCEGRQCNFGSSENWISISDCQHKRK